jgi:NTE family protein
MEDHWRTGYENARRTLTHPEVLSLPSDPSGVAVYDFTHEPAEHEVPAKSQKEPL